jgi:hypothetical protein
MLNSFYRNGKAIAQLLSFKVSGAGTVAFQNVKEQPQSQ